MTHVAIFDPFSGIAGDMTLGALIQCGLDADWLRALPERLGVEGVTVKIDQVVRSGIACAKVDFEIPTQPHGRHLKQLLGIVDGSAAPEDVKSRCRVAFTAIAEIEAGMHGTTVERVHLHEVGAVDAILDVVGSIWGLHQLSVSRCFTGEIAVGDGSVHTAHGLLPVPAPATLRLLEGLSIRTGPKGSGELATPTGVALLKALDAAPMPERFTPIRSGYGAGTKDFPGRPNALRLIIATLDRHDLVSTEDVIVLSADVDDMTGEQLALSADALRSSGALDVVLIGTHMKKGRTGTRIEVLCLPATADRLTEAVLNHTSTLGVRRAQASRAVLPRRDIAVEVNGMRIRVKAAFTPGGSAKLKAEADDVAEAARRSGRPGRELAREAEERARALLVGSGEVITDA